MSRTATGFVLLVLAGALPVQAQKTDVVTLQNGDQVTGEIKDLKRGILQYGTDDMSTVAIKWDHVEKLASIWFFEVELRSGQKYFGSFLDGAEPGTLLVALPPSQDTLSLASIVRIQPIQVSFWQQLDGFVDVGFNYARANRNTQLTASARVTYRGRRWGGTARGETYFQTQTETDATSRNSAQLSAERFFALSLWSALLFTALEQNTELDLAIRGRIGGGAIRTVHQSNTSILRLAGGLSLSAERFTAGTGDPSANDTTALNLEGLISFEWAVFRLDAPKLEVLTTGSTFPSITDFGRVRADLNLRVSYEIVKDFFLSLTGNGILDSRPPVADATNVDFSTKFTLGWSF